MPATTKQPETTKQHAQSTQPTQSTPAAQPAQPAQSVPATGTTVNVQGPGFFGSLLQGFGWGAGSSLGHAAAGALLGGASSNSPSEEGREEPVAAETPVEQDSVPKQENFDDVCRVQLKDFQSCLESSNQQLSACQMYYESLKACQERANQMKEF